MSDSVDRVFVHALNTVKRIPRTGTARPPTAERLKLYGLYKQSMEGDVEGVMDRPIGNTTEVYAECEKWDAWFAQRGVSRTEAKRRYISTLIETMHRYASQTPEARELVAELEFVWDQIKSNTAHMPLSSPSSPESGSHGQGYSHTQRVGVPPLSPPEVRQSQLQAYSQSRLLQQRQEQQEQQQRGYANIGGRLAQPYEDMVAIASANNGRESSSRLRVLSPVSQPDEIYQRRGRRMQDYDDEGSQEQQNLEEEDDEEEQYEEAQDTLYDDDDNDKHNQRTSEEEEEQDNPNDGGDSSSSVQQHHGSKPSHSNNNDGGRKRSKPSDTRRWRRRVEQALTKMTAEIAAIREQMEIRAIQHRRRTSAWAWIKWLAWVTLRQVLWDLAVLAMLLIWMRIKGDRRVEEKLKKGWSEVRRRLGRLRGLRGHSGVMLP